MARHVAHTGKRRGAYKVLMAKTDGKTPLENLDKHGSLILK
jgi:hypothetical protein